jgi:thiol:disulfide interchange protein DsbD
MPDPIRILRRLRAALASLALAALAMPAAAASIDDLLPVDDAFALTTRATDAGIELRWKIADGYYLYRHRTAVQADAGFAAGALRLPKGKAYTDEFFGPVETYRDELVAVLPGTPRAARTVLTVKFQGCADVGICYPPQTRKVSVSLPGAAAASIPDPFARATGGGAPGLFGGATPGGQALPLPEAQAFGFEAIARDGDTLLLRFTPAKGYYIYRDRTSLRLDDDARARGFALAAPRWPPAQAYRDEHFGDVRVYFDPVDVPVPVVRRDGGAATLRLVATFQGCQTGGICYPPMTRTVEVALPAGTVGAIAGAADPATGPTTTASSGAPPVAGGTGAPTDASPGAGPATDADSATPGRPTPSASTPGDAAAPRAIAAGGIASALLLALLGGLVLNLMPCVLPVLSLKALSLAESGTPGAARRHALGYTAGVLVSFVALGAAALGLRETGLALGWGFQLQQPLVVAGLALVMFALGLNLSGLWHLGGRWIGAGHSLTQRHGLAGDFFTGVLAVVVATPCTAPFMGAALAWAFVAPAPLALAVFAMLGLGLALPFVLIGVVPALAQRLPRPGAWMETLKQALAFPLYLTAAWLLWVLGRQRGADAIAWALVGLVAVAFAAWAWSRSQHRRRLWSLPALLVATAALAYAGLAIQRLPRPEAGTARIAVDDASRVAYSAERLAALRAARRTVFVNMTADWCVTCKANEKTVLGGDDFRNALADANAVYMVGDWTDVDPAITAFLQEHRAVGVPLYVVYPRDGGAPRVLPTVLTPAIVRDALREGSR